MRSLAGYMGILQIPAVNLITTCRKRLAPFDWVAIASAGTYNLAAEENRNHDTLQRFLSLRGGEVRNRR